MTTDIASFWPPDLTGVEFSPPSAILAEAASQLVVKTQSLVEGKTRSGRNTSGDIVHHLLLVVPALEGYQYELVKLRHAVEAYPVLVTFVPEGVRRNFQDETQLREFLRAALASDRTKHILGSLMAQARVGGYK